MTTYNAYQIAASLTIVVATTPDGFVATKLAHGTTKVCVWAATAADVADIVAAADTYAAMAKAVAVAAAA